MNVNQRRKLTDLITGVSVQIDNSGRIRDLVTPDMGLVTVQVYSVVQMNQENRPAALEQLEKAASEWLAASRTGGIIKDVTVTREVADVLKDAIVELRLIDEG